MVRRFVLFLLVTGLAGAVSAGGPREGMPPSGAPDYSEGGMPKPPTPPATTPPTRPPQPDTHGIPERVIQTQQQTPVEMRPGVTAKLPDDFESCGSGCAGKVEPFKRGQSEHYVVCHTTPTCRKRGDDCRCHLFNARKGTRKLKHVDGEGNLHRVDDEMRTHDYYCYCGKMD